MAARGGKKVRGKGRSRVKKNAGKQQSSFVRVLFWRLVVVGCVASLAGIIYLDAWVQNEFSGKKWALPAKVYARPLELYTGLKLAPEDFRDELEAIGYRFGMTSPFSPQGKPGSARQDGDLFEIMTRAFQFWDEQEPVRRLRIRFNQPLRSHSHRRDP